MKKIFKTYFIIAVMITAGGCNFLDYNEQELYTKEQVFNNFDRTKDFLTGIYNQLPEGFNAIGGSMRANASDDAEEANQLSLVQAMNDGRWSASQPIDNQWSEMYYGIRLANRLLNNLDMEVLEERRFNDGYAQLVDQYELFDEQARFLRAYFYFELMRRYGGVPLLDGRVLTLEEVNTVEPDSFDEVSNFIVAEMDAIIDGLPVDYDNIPDPPNKGRITRGAAMALKARTLLYAASPLHGSSQQEWAAAAEAAFDLIDAGSYKLDDDYEDVVNNSESDELILGRRFGNSNFFERSNFPVGYEGAEPGTAPTQNLVDTYEMINGKDIDEPDSEYDPQNPYENRDPRLAATIIFNGSKWKDRDVEIWRDGQDGLPKPFASETGYYLKKYVREEVNLDPDRTSTARHLWVYFRYTEVLLNFAEAMNEAYGPESDPEGYGMTAIDALNMVRNRVGLPDYEGTITQDAVRQEIRDERRVELAFENHRFWDLRRWQIGNETNEIRGMEITRNEDGTFNYTPKVVETRTWDDKMYLYPIPASEMFKNTLLQQNPGWN